ISHPVRPRSRRRLPPCCLHHLVGHPAEEKGIGSFQTGGPVAHGLLVRDHPHPVIAAAVERDVDRVSERSHRRVAPPCFSNVTVTVETIASCTRGTPGSWWGRGAAARTLLHPRA